MDQTAQVNDQSGDRASSGWVSVRCVLRFPGDPRSTYEERITLWRDRGMEAAIALAEAEARDYAAAVDAEYAGLAQGYQLEAEPGHGAEVFSLMRDGELHADAYLDAFFDTGSERQQSVNGS